MLIPDSTTVVYEIQTKIKYLLFIFSKLRVFFQKVGILL